MSMRVVLSDLAYKMGVYMLRHLDSNGIGRFDIYHFGSSLCIMPTYFCYFFRGYILDPKS